MDAQGKEVPGARGYKYFGRAKELPGVKELFQPKVATLKEKSRAELLRNVDADYYGYRDEEDGTLLEYEQEQEELGKKTALEETQHGNSCDMDVVRILFCKMIMNMCLLTACYLLLFLPLL